MFFLFAFDHVGKFRLITCIAYSKFPSNALYRFLVIGKGDYHILQKMALPLALVLTQYSKAGSFFRQSQHQGQRKGHLYHFSGKQQNPTCFVLGQT